jgi:hypothetical protein
MLKEEGRAGSHILKTCEYYYRVLTGTQGAKLTHIINSAGLRICFLKND